MGFGERTAIVTGGGRGIGKAAAVRLANEGARVLVADIDGGAADAVAAEIGGQALAYALDVTSPESWDGAVARVMDAWGRLDILVNNAGIAGRSAPIWDLAIDEWHEVVAIDLTGVWLGCRAALTPMLAAGYGRIVNISSIAGKEGNPNAGPYSAAKAGVIGLTKSIAKEVATKGILCNAITPAVISTPILDQVSAEHLAYMMSKIPMNRTGQPEEVAALICFLSSEEVSFSNGAVFDISGGRATY